MPSLMDNPVLAPWTGPYGGVPPFEAVRVEHFVPAFESAMAEQLAEVERIADGPAEPTFENTLAALERSGRALDRVQRVYDVFAGALSTPEFRAVELELAPKLAAFRDRIVQHERLFARIDAVYQARETPPPRPLSPSRVLAGEGERGLAPEQRRLTWLVHTRFVLAGARLDAAAKERVGRINERLAELETSFTQNLLADEGARLVLESEEDLAGLPESLRAAMAAASEEAGYPGKWAVLNTRSAVEPFLAFSTRRDLREQVWRAFVRRGDNGGARDNGPVIREILRLRAERARLLGHPTHAHLRLEDRMARTPERAMALMEKVWPAAVARAREEVAEMQALADAEAAAGGEHLSIEPWDHRFFAEKVRKARYDVDEGQVKPYLQLEKLREAAFWIAGRLFDLRFEQVQGVPVYHPDVRVFEVQDGAGKAIGLWYFDPYARPGKRSGAWMDEYRPQRRIDPEGPVIPIVTNVANFVKGTPGEPVLVSWDDARVIFHEFGHALHGLLSDVEYPSLAGTSVPLDGVELASQLLERWLLEPEVLNRFALHHRTGEPIPSALVERLERSAKFNQGFAMVEYLSCALVDMKLHLLGGEADPAAFEREALTALGVPREVGMRHRLPQFAHLFAPGGYSAGYYAYLWAEVLAADAFAAFVEAGDPFDPGVAGRLRRFVLSAGNTVDPADGYRAFRGRDPEVAALMRWRGFEVGGEPG